jgi:hypothetical protein
MNFRYLTNLFYCLCFFASLTLTVSCKTSEEDIPSYISVDSINLSAELKEGTASHKITDSWVYVNKKLIGAFEMPASFPVLDAGSSTVVITPGVRMNGVANTRIPYPFYNDITTTVNLQREQVTALGKLNVTYNSKTVFAWVEDFENSSFSLDTTQRSNVKAIRTNDVTKVFNYPGESSHYSAIAEFTGDSTVFECVSHSLFEVPQDGTAVFLELNYRTNTPLTIGVFGRTATQTIQQPVFVLNPNLNWNKIYINLTPTVNEMSTSYDFRIYFSATKSADIDAAEVLLDNIKLLHF